MTIANVLRKQMSELWKDYSQWRAQHEGSKRTGVE